MTLRKIAKLSTLKKDDLPNLALHKHVDDLNYRKSVFKKSLPLKSLFPHRWKNL